MTRRTGYLSQAFRWSFPPVWPSIMACSVSQYIVIANPTATYAATLALPRLRCPLLMLSLLDCFGLCTLLLWLVQFNAVACALSVAGWCPHQLNTISGADVLLVAVAGCIALCFEHHFARWSTLKLSSVPVRPPLSCRSLQLSFVP